MFNVLVTYLLPDEVYMHVEQFKHVPRVGEFIQVGQGFENQQYRIIQVVHVLVAEKGGQEPYLYSVSVEKCSIPHPIILRLEDEAGG